jgi:hypothetical protein
MRLATEIEQPFRPDLLITVDPAVASRPRDSKLTAKVRQRHFLLLVTRQELQALIHDTTLFPGHTASSCVRPKGEEPSRFQRAVTRVLGLFCNASAKYAQELRSWRTQGAPSSSALRLCRPPLRSALTSFRGWNPPLAFATLAGVGLGQGVFGSKHSTAIQKRRNHP